MCSYCNQHSISGVQAAPTADEVKTVCAEAFEYIGEKSNTEIAFFGGSFTAIERTYMLELLECVQEFIGEDKFAGIRISTRPDCINEEILDILKRYNVRAIELGAQSMDDTVLAANRRGHTAADVEKAGKLIKEYGFELGLQMMVGLYKSTEELEYETMRRIAALKPDTVRIYPVAVLEGTHLAELYKSGEYVLYPMERAIAICADMLCFFAKKEIRVIRCGLHASEMVSDNAVAGFYHPAFKELAEAELVRRTIDAHIDAEGDYVIEVARGMMSKAIGQKKSNTEYFSGKGIRIKFKENAELESNCICIAEEVYNVFKNT